MALSILDPLTGTYNRNYLNDHLPKEIKRAQKYLRSLSIVLCDIDRFKSINDTYGHLAGDRALTAFVQCISSSIRLDVDWIARFGGDEFIIVLPETTVEGGGAAAERFARIIRQKFIEIEGEKIHLSATFGVTGFDRAPIDESIDINSLIGIADRCLYEAKHREKGTVRIEPWRRAADPSGICDLNTGRFADGDCAGYLRLEELQVLAVAFLLQIFLRYEPQSRRVDAVAESRRPRPVGEDVAEVRIAALAPHLGARREQAPVFLLHDVARLEGLREARPPRAGIELVEGAEERLARHDVDVDPLAMVVPVRFANGGSVPHCCVTSYCIGESVFFSVSFPSVPSPRSP